MSAGSRRHLEEGQMDLAVIRTSLETIQLFACDDPLAAELRSLIDAARASLTRRLEIGRRSLPTGSAGPDLAAALRDLEEALGDEEHFRDLAAFEGCISRRYEAALGLTPDG